MPTANERRRTAAQARNREALDSSAVIQARRRGTEAALEAHNRFYEAQEQKE